ncbi:hypothetical protein SAMN06265222_11152 [Neorhodopirellula lusitana]|uniref:Uncharacterized protein n=1 Tax=Neorhodopirellula lusitana TaxID=445327 RepID=A0ABY1QH64_9BACT|nr:hypothetical protein SAMN06265222_11152 [Neorhodopirellula lusitana]
MGGQADWRFPEVWRHRLLQRHRLLRGRELISGDVLGDEFGDHFAAKLAELFVTTAVEVRQLVIVEP